jgi:hypothetical protein
MTLCVALDGLEGNVADNVFHFAGIFHGGVFVNADGAEELGDKGMSLKHFLCDLLAAFGEEKEAVLVGNDVAAAFQKTHGAAYAGLGIAHVFAYVDGAYGAAFLAEDVYGFKIHLAGFL